MRTNRREKETYFSPFNFITLSVQHLELVYNNVTTKFQVMIVTFILLNE